MIFIPPRDSKTLVQTSRSNVLGSLWSTFNLDLQSNLGAVRLSPRLRLNASTADDADFGLPCAFAHFDARMWTIAGTRIFKNSANTIIGALATEDTSTGVRTDYTATYSDLAVFNGRLWATSSVRLQSKVSNGSGTGAWTDRATITTGTHHRLAYFRKFDRLYFTDNSTQVKSIDTSDALYDDAADDYFINIGSSVGTIQCMAASSTRIWIGTMREITASGANSTKLAKILEWDGLTGQIINEYDVTGQAVLAIAILDDIPYVMDSNGVLLVFTGSGFKEIGRLAIGKEYLLNAIGSSQWFIHPNGIVPTKDGTLLFLLNGALGDYSVSSRNLKENFPSGVWEWSERNGFIHKQSVSYTPVFIAGVEATDIKDFGQMRLEDVGAIANANLYSTSSSGRGTIICGATYFTDATTTTHGCFIDSPIPTNIAATSEGKKFGSFVTTWIQSSVVKDNWVKLIAKYKQFLNSSDKISIKYRTVEATPVEITLTWASTTSFSTATDVSAYVGYEVEVLNGTGAGKCAHITAVSGSGPYSVTLDESFVGTTSGTAKARIQNWTWASSISNQTSESASFVIGKASERIQIKCAMQFTGDGEVHELALINKPHELMV